MNLLHPSFLWALAFLAIPVIVHLFNLRKYRKEKFTNTRLLKNFLTETKKISKIKRRLLLASRLLALLCIILAFVQPFFDSNGGRGSGKIALSIYIDNSQSMNLPSAMNTGLEEAKQKALDIVRSYQNQAQYQIISNDFNSNQLQLLNHQEAIETIKSLKSSMARKSIENIWHKQVNILKQEDYDNKKMYWISDFQKNQFQNSEEIKGIIHAIPIIHSSLDNIGIDTVYLDKKYIKINDPITIIFKARKSKTTKSPKSLVTLFENNQKKLQKEIIWTDRSEYTDSFKIIANKSDWHFYKISITDPYLSFDNDYFYTFRISPKPTIQLVRGDGDIRFLANALKVDGNFHINETNLLKTTEKEEDQTTLYIVSQIKNPNQKDADIINKHLKYNKNIAIFLPKNAVEQNYNLFLDKLNINTLHSKIENSSNIKEFNTQDPILSDVFTSIDKLADLPHTKYFYTTTGLSNRSREVLITLDNGYPFLIRYSKAGEGSIFLFTSVIESDVSNLVFSSIFAPIIYKLASSNVGIQSPSYHLDQNSSIQIPITQNNQDGIFHLKNREISMIPPQRVTGKVLNISLDQNIEKEGIYSVHSQKNDVIHHLAINHSRKESDFVFFDKSQLIDNFSNVDLIVDSGEIANSKAVQSITGNNLWKLWLIFALLFLLAEMLIARFWDRYFSKTIRG